MTMPARLFTSLFVILTLALTGMIVWASLEKSVIEIFKVMWAERWGIVTLVDLYTGFIVTGTWICLLERRPLRSAAWLIALFFLGNLATAVFILYRARRATSLREIFMAFSPGAAAHASMST